MDEWTLRVWRGIRGLRDDTVIDDYSSKCLAKLVEQARASEREKVQKEGFEKGGWVQIDSKAFLIMMEKKEAEIRASEREKIEKMGTYFKAFIENIKKEAYAKGRHDEREQYTQKMYLEDAYKKGQANLVAKGWEILQSYNDTALWHSKHFLLMLEKASESLGANGAARHTTARTGADAGKPKPEKPCGCCDISKCEKHSFHTPPEKPCGCCDISKCEKHTKKSFRQFKEKKVKP